eukprot:6185530-Pleurochrysis_carterae.AAC.1
MGKTRGKWVARAEGFWSLGRTFCVKTDSREADERPRVCCDSDARGLTRSSHIMRRELVEHAVRLFAALANRASEQRERVCRSEVGMPQLHPRLRQREEQREGARRRNLKSTRERT